MAGDAWERARTRILTALLSMTAAAALVSGPPWRALFLLGLAVYVAGLLVRWSLRNNAASYRERQRGLAAAARRLDLRKTASGLAGKSDGFSLTVQESLEGDDDGVQIVVDSAGRAEGMIPEGLLIEGRGKAVRGAGTEQGKDVSVGDREFDEAFRLRGERLEAVALMSGETRKALAEALAVDDSFRVEGGRLLLEVPDGGRESGGLEKRIVACLALAKALVPPAGGVAGLLARNALKDRRREVRLRNLALLAKSFGDRPETASTLRALLGDRSFEVRFRAARHLGEEGYEHLEAFVVAGETRRDLAARSLAYLSRHVEAERVLPLARRAFLAGAPPLRLYALRVLVSLGDGDVEAMALSALTSDWGPLRRAAVELLAERGTAAAVAPLRAAAGERRLDRAFRRLVDEAVARIQARLEGAEAGQVSLAGAAGEEGRVTLADEERRGRVSMESESQ